MARFSANLGLLWRELPLPDAIAAAKQAGFAAVECHWPYDEDAAAVKRALADAGLPLLGLNTLRGDAAAGEAGLAAVPGRSDDARRHIDQAVARAAELGCAAIHVMAGKAAGAEAHAAFAASLAYAAEQAAPRSITILIEPLNRYDFPGYFLTSTAQARGLIEEVGAPGVKLMFDCYHLQLLEGDLSNGLERHMDIIGHIQFAAVPDRGAPDHGEVDYAHVFARIDELGYQAPLGAEYKPAGGDTAASLGWLRRLGAS